MRRLARLVRAIVVLASSATPALRAQAVHDAASDSAAVARTAWRDAASASSLAVALPLAERAAIAWPMQPVYWTTLARLATRAADTVRFARAMRMLERFQLAPTIRADSALWRGVQQLRPQDTARIASLARELRAGRLLTTIADSTVFAEGIDADQRTGTLYVASIRQRTVLAVRDGVSRDLGLHRDARVGAVFGVRVSPDGRTLWCTSVGHENAPGTATVAAVLLEVDAATGAIRRVVPLPAAPAGRSRLPGDLVLSADGSVLISDSDAPAVLRYEPRTDRWEVFTDPRWRSPQGLAFIPGQHAMILADWSHGLFRLDLATRAVTRVHVPDGITVLGLDGLTWYDGGVLAVQNGVEPARIVHITLTTAGTAWTAMRVVDRQPTLAPDPTIGTRVGNAYLYVANSQWHMYANGARTQVPLTPTRLVCVPLTPARRSGTRSTDSAPPPDASCKLSDAAAP